MKKAIPKKPSILDHKIDRVIVFDVALVLDQIMELINRYNLFLRFTVLS